MQAGFVLHLSTKCEADSSIRSKVIRGGVKNFEIGSRDQATPIYVSFYIPYAGGVRPPSLYQI